MGCFLHKIWDETLAGPAPETGLGKLRKYNSYSGGGTIRSPMTEDVPVSRTITIVRTHSAAAAAATHTTTSEPASPSVPITPRTPLTPEMPGGDFRKFTRRKSSVESDDHRSRTIYDWVIMSALDR